MRILAPLALLSLLTALPARADDPAPDLDAAKAVVTRYLDAVKAKKWDVARKTLHPKSSDLIADVKKRTGVENHPLAAWTFVKEHYLVKYELGEARASVRGAVVVRSTEEHFSVEDKGSEEGVAAEYLVIPAGGVWYLTDRRLGDRVYDDKSLAASFRGYFEGEFDPPVAAVPKKKGKKG